MDAIPKTTVTQSDREELREGLLLGDPELKLSEQDNPDPRLVQLARMLGRQMARQHYDAQLKKRG
ncbi:hypothetical protein [Ensifer soli]|uniref:hypothetical protein n=1 Tax=Ciceribacter sp. sgz301302 TaxID=3342379 RepID=UPI0035BAC8A4